MVYFNMYNLLIYTLCNCHQKKANISIFSYNFFSCVWYEYSHCKFQEYSGASLTKSHFAALIAPRLIHLAQLSPYPCEKQPSTPPASLVPGKDHSPSAAVLNSTFK